MLQRSRTLRVRLLTILLYLTLLTVLGMGVSGYLHVRSTADDLTRKLLDQTSARIDHRIDDLVHTATSQGDINLHLLKAGQLSPADFDRMAGYWSEVLQVRRNMSNIFLTLEADGTSLLVANLPGRGLTIQEQRPGRKKGETDLFNYRPEDYPRRALNRVAEVVR